MSLYHRTTKHNPEPKRSPRPFARAKFARQIARDTFGRNSPRPDTEIFSDRKPNTLPAYWLDGREVINQSLPDGAA